MPRKQYSTEQIITKLRQADVELGRGLKTPQVCKTLGISEQTYLLSVAEGIRRPPARPGQAAEGPRAGEYPAKEAGSGPGTRQRDSQRGGLGKLLSPSRRRPAVVRCSSGWACQRGGRVA